MKFRDNKHFSEFFKLSFDELALLEKSFGYISYDSKIDQVIDELDLVTTKAEFKLFKKKYQNYMTTKIRDNEESYECIVPPNTYSLIANENGLYYIGGTAYRVIGEYLISSEIKDVSKLLKIEYDDLVNQGNSQDFKTKKYIEIQESISNSLKSTTGYLSGDLNDNATNPANNRKVFLRAYAFTDQVTGGHVYCVNLYAWGQKKGWFGWRSYKTSIDLYGSGAGTDVDWYTTYWGNSSSYVYNYHASRSKTLSVQLFNRTKLMSGNGDPIYFTKVKLKAHTGGTTPATYAEINEQE